jgi:hypothetical protein
VISDLPNSTCVGNEYSGASLGGNVIATPSLNNNSSRSALRAESLEAKNEWIPACENVNTKNKTNKQILVILVSYN